MSLKDLIDKGFNPGLKGFVFLKEILDMAEKDLPTERCLQKYYKNISKKYNIAVTAVDRNLRTLISKHKYFRGKNIPSVIAELLIVEKEGDSDASKSRD